MQIDGANPDGALEADIEPPRRIHVQEIGTEWTARWRWFTPSIFGLMFFCIVWDSFLVFWYVIALRTHSSWGALVFPIGHAAVGGFLSYVVAANLFNSTELRATRGQLMASCRPLPWPSRNITLAAKNIREITTSDSGGWTGSKTISFGVFVLLDDGQSKRVAGRLRDEDEATYIRQQLEKRLNIPPVPRATASAASSSSDWGGAKMTNASGSAPPIWFGAIFALAGLLFISTGMSLLAVQRYRLATYVPVPARVISSTVRSHTSSGSHGSSTTYEPVVSYKYTVKGHHYTSSHVMPGASSSSSGNWAWTVTNQYRPGTKTTAWYCPSDPTQAFLIHRLDNDPYIFALFPAIFFAVGVGLMITSHHTRRPMTPPVSDRDGWFHIVEAGTIRRRFWIASLITLLWYGYCGALIGDYAHIQGLDEFVFIASAACLVLGLVGLIPAWRYWRLGHEFLEANLSISQRQIHPGDKIQFRVRQGLRRPMEIDKLSLGVVCLRDQRIKSSNSVSYNTVEAWSHWVDLQVNRTYAAGAELHAQGELPLCNDAPASSPQGGGEYPRYRWLLELKVTPQVGQALDVKFPIVVEAKH